MSMTETATPATGDNGEAKRTRYTGEVNLVDLDSMAVDESVLATVRERVDLTPYIKKLKENNTKNKGRQDGKKEAWTFSVNTEAVSTVKSRINQAGKEANLGVTFKTYDSGTHKIGARAVTVPAGQTLILVVTGKRAVGRGRKPKSQTV